MKNIFKSIHPASIYTHNRYTKQIHPASINTPNYIHRYIIDKFIYENIKKLILDIDV